MPGASDNTVLVSVFSAFGLVISLWLLAILAWSVRRALRIQRVDRRLGLEDEESVGSRVVRLWRDGQETTTTVPSLRSTGGLWNRLDRYFASAGWQVSAVVVLLGLVGLLTMSAVITQMLTGSWSAATVVAIGAFVLAMVVIRVRVDRRIAAFEGQFADALAMVSRSLRAGQPLLAGLQLAAQQLPNPVRDMFGEICQNHVMGMTLEDSIRRVGFQYDSSDLRLFATAVIIQIQTGGNLADLIDRLATVIRDRMRLMRRVRVLTAQTRLSSRILIAMPFIIFLLVTVINPQYMKPLLSTPIGHLALLFGGTLIIIGMMVMKWLAVLRY